MLAGDGDTMSHPKPPEHDDDGNPLALPDPQSDVGQLIYLLEWARIRGFRIGPEVRIGGLGVVVRDLRQTEKRRDPDDTVSNYEKAGPWAAHGHEED